VGALLGDLVGAHPYRLPRPVPLLPGRRAARRALFFFLVSTLITGCPAAVNSLTWPLLDRNCASRSTVAGALGPPRGALQGEPLGGEQRGHRVRAHRVPLGGPGSAASFRVEVTVQRNGDSGSPR
jgi:hypothetical protein